MIRNGAVTDPCRFCTIIDGSTKVSPTTLQAREGECLSLSQQCLHKIATTKSLLDPTQLGKLPIPLLEELKFYLTDGPLFSLSDLFRKKGIDTKLVWEMLIYKRFGYKHLALCEDWIAPWFEKPMAMFQVAEESQEPYQLYMAKLCQKLTEAAMNAYDRNMDDMEQGICKPCLTRFSAYVSSLTSFTLSWKQLSWIVEADTCVANALESMLEQVVDLELVNVPDFVEDEDVEFLQDLLDGNKLKSLSLGALYPRSGYCNELLVALLSTDDIEEERSQDLDTDEDDDSESDRDHHWPLDLFDEALRRTVPADWDQRAHSLADLSEIRERIQAMEQSQDELQEEEEGLESLCVQMWHILSNMPFDELVYFIKLVQGRKSIKRLDYISRDDQGWNEVCAMVGCRRLTHLRVKSPNTICFLMLATLFENFRADDGRSQPMEFLGFCSVITVRHCDPGLLDYDYPIAAVRRLEIVDSDLSASLVANFHLLLQHNTVLTHLQINSVAMDALLPIASIVSAVAKHRTLESLVLCNDIDAYLEAYMLSMRTAEDEEAVVSLLKTNPQLKHLVLNGCNVKQKFVSSEAFLSAVKSHEGLEHLSLSNNNLKMSAVDLLLAISQPQAATSLKALCLDKCQIIGKRLVAAARVISDHYKGQVFLSHLSLCHNRVNLKELLELQRCFSTCVQLPHIEGSSRKCNSHLTAFDEEAAGWDENWDEPFVLDSSAPPFNPLADESDGTVSRAGNAGIHDAGIGGDEFGAHDAGIDDSGIVGAEFRVGNSGSSGAEFEAGDTGIDDSGTDGAEFRVDDSGSSGAEFRADDSGSSGAEFEAGDAEIGEAKCSLPAHWYVDAKGDGEHNTENEDEENERGEQKDE